MSIKDVIRRPRVAAAQKIEQQLMFLSNVRADYANTVATARQDPGAAILKLAELHDRIENEENKVRGDTSQSVSLRTLGSVLPLAAVMVPLTKVFANESPQQLPLFLAIDGALAIGSVALMLQQRDSARDKNALYADILDGHQGAIRKEIDILLNGPQYAAALERSPSLVEVAKKFPKAAAVVENLQRQGVPLFPLREGPRVMIRAFG